MPQLRKGKSDSIAPNVRGAFTLAKAADRLGGRLYVQIEFSKNSILIPGTGLLWHTTVRHSLRWVHGRRFCGHPEPSPQQKFPFPRPECGLHRWPKVRPRSEEKSMAFPLRPQKKVPKTKTCVPCLAPESVSTSVRHLTKMKRAKGYYYVWLT